MQKYRKEMALGLFILAAGALLAYMSVTIGKFQFGDSLEVKALFDNASGIVKDAPIMLAGIEVGHVDKMEVKNNQALMSLVIKPDTEVRKDAKAVIRSKSLLGEKYISIEPGSSTAPILQDGDFIVNTRVPVDLDQVLDRLAPVLIKINPDDVNTIIHTAAVAMKGNEQKLRSLITHMATVMETVSVNDGALERIVANLDGLTSQANGLLSRHGGSLDRIIRNMDVIATAFGKGSPQLANRLDKISGDFVQVSDTLRTKTPGLMDKVDQIATDASKLTRQLGEHPDIIPNMDATLSRLPGVLDKTPATLDRLPPLLDKMGPTLDNANLLFKRVDQSLTKLEPTLEKAGELLDKDEIRKMLQIEGIKTKVTFW